MKLPKEDVELFYKLYPNLLLYLNQKKGVIKGLRSRQDFTNLADEEKVKIRDELTEQMIDTFVKENPVNFSEAELELLLSWKNLVHGTFFIIRYLKKYAIFLDEQSPCKAYGVLALSWGFDEIFGPRLPVMVKATLLPFRGRIIYDGFLPTYNLFFGGGMRRNFEDGYREAKLRFGIITSLPFEAKDEPSDAEKLKFYLRNKQNRARYNEAINQLILENPALLKLYHQEMGKIHARSYGKRLREIGVNKGWFAILDDVLLASGITREQVEQILQELLPEKIDLCYIFQLRHKG